MRFSQIAAEAPRYGVEFRRVLGRDGSDHGWVVERGDGLRAVVYRLGPRLWSACCGAVRFTGTQANAAHWRLTRSPTAIPVNHHRPARAGQELRP
jgi:hypothetical protein